MKNKSTMVDMKITLLIIMLTISSFTQAEEWYAMVHHGECIELAKMTNRTDTIKGAQSPVEIEAILKKADIDYTLVPMHEEFEGMLRFNVPSKEWAMILVKEKYCQEFLER